MSCHKKLATLNGIWIEMPNQAIKYAPCGRRTSFHSAAYCGRYVVRPMKILFLLLLFPLQSIAQLGLSSDMEEAFTNFFSDPKGSSWERIVEIGDKTDGSYALEFSLWSFELIKERPIALYRIYLEGDDRAAFVQSEAFEYDFSAFNVNPALAEEKILPVYTSYIARIEELSTEGYSSKEIGRHQIFLGLAKAELSKWRQDWKNFLD